MTDTERPASEVGAERGRAPTPPPGRSRGPVRVAGRPEETSHRTARGLWRRTSAMRWLLPSIALIGLVIVFPALYMVGMSFLSIDRIGQIQGFTGLDNYRRLLDEPALPGVVANTLMWLVVVLSATILVSLALAQFLTKEFCGRRLVRLAVVVPWAASLVMTATVWRFLLEGGNGLINRVLMDLSLIDAPYSWYENPDTAFYSIMVVGVITSVPFTTYVLLAGLQTIPTDVHEAARIDGAGAWHRWFHVTLPLLRPSLLVAFVLNMLHVFNAFMVIWVITGTAAGNHADTTVTWMYKIAFTEQLDLGEAAALGVLNVAFLIGLIALLAWLLLSGRRIRAGRAIASAVPGGPRSLTGTVSRSWSHLRGRVSRACAPVLRPVAEAGGRVWRRVRPAALPVVGALIALFFLAPYVAMFLGSLKTDAELFAVPATYLPKDWAWSNYVEVWDQIPLANYFRVSLTIAGVSTLVVLAVAAPAAYVIARSNFRGRGAFLGLILITQMFPAVALIIGLYREALFLNGVNSYWFIIAVNSAFNIAFAVWILNAHFKAVPRETEEAAMMDGLGRFRTMMRIIVPLSAPGIITVTVFTFIQVWNEFIVALTLFNDPSQGRAPLTVGVQQFIGLYQTNYQYLFAAALMAIVPAVVLFALIEKYLVSGLTTGSVR